MSPMYSPRSQCTPSSKSPTISSSLTLSLSQTPSQISLLIPPSLYSISGCKPCELSAYPLSLAHDNNTPSSNTRASLYKPYPSSSRNNDIPRDLRSFYESRQPRRRTTKEQDAKIVDWVIMQVTRLKDFQTAKAKMGAAWHNFMMQCVDTYANRHTSIWTAVSA